MTTATAVLTTRQLNRAVLARQMLLARVKESTLGAVTRLVAMQAQEPRHPFVGLWTRLEDFERGDLTRALQQRKIVRGTALRGTLHLMTAKDFVDLRGAMQPALSRGALSILKDRAKGADPKVLDTLARTFFGKGQAPFDALRDHIKSKYPKADERAWAYLIRMNVPTVQVPTDAKWSFPASSDFSLADAWLGRKVSVDEKPAHTLVLRYLAAFGPASVTDAQAWSFLSNLRTVFEDLRPKLVTFRDSRKRELFDLPDAPRPSEDTDAPVRFIPDFDNLLLSYDDRTRVIANEHRKAVMGSGNLRIRATVLVDGFVAATWRIERKKTSAVLAVEPFGKLSKASAAAIEKEGDSLLRFVEEDATSRVVRLS